MNPNISEAARRAARAVLLPRTVCIPNFANEEEEDAWRENRLAAIIQSALDSAHLAPKESEPVNRFTLASWMSIYGRDSLKEFVREEDFAALELRLAEKTRRLQKAEELLRPLANLDISSADGLKHKDDRPIFGLNWTQITVGDVRSARTFLNQDKT